MEQRVSFIIRVAHNEGQDLRGQIEHVPTGTTGHFRDLNQAHAFIHRHLAARVIAAPSRRGLPLGATVNSVFSFLRRRSAPPSETQESAPATELSSGVGDETPPDEPLAAEAERPVVEAEIMAAALPEGLTPPSGVQAYVNRMLDLFHPFLPPSTAGIPSNTLSVVQLSHRALGLGGRRGLLRQGGIEVAELRGGWLDVVLAFDIWGNDLDTVNTRAAGLQAALLTNSTQLRRDGILRLRLVDTSDSATTDDPPRWRKLLKYAVLYEYQYQDADGAASLIVNVSVDNQSEIDPTDHELTEVRDWIVRWDNETMPTLEVVAPPRGEISIRGLSIAAYLPGTVPDGQVIQEITHNGTTVTTTFESLTTFLDSFQLQPGQPLELVNPPQPLAEGEMQEIRAFQVGEQRFDPLIVLRGSGDSLRIRFSADPFPVDNPSQIYLRALGR